MSVENSLVKSERLATYPDSKSMDEHGGSGLLVQAPKRRCSGSVLRLLGAFLCVVGAIVTWVTMAEKLQKLNENYKKPYFISYWVHSSYALLYVVWQLWRSFPGSFRCNRVGSGAFPKSLRLVGVSAILSMLALLSGYTWYYSLPRTNIPANTAIYQSACVFVFVLSVPFLRERVTVVKVGSVLLSVVGVALVAVYSSKSQCDSPLSPSNNSSQPTNSTPQLTNIHKGGGDQCAEQSTPIGYVLLLASVLCYASFEVSFKRFATQKEDPAAVQNSVRFLGYMGVHTVLWQWWPLIILHYSKVETFEWPTMEIVGLLFLNAFLDLSFNACILICTALSSPLFVSVGTILAIPTAVVVDLIVQGFLLPVLGFVGIALIIFGFTGFIFSELVAARREGEGKKRELQLQASGSEPSESDPLLDEEGRRGKQVWWKTFLRGYVL